MRRSVLALVVVLVAAAIFWAVAIRPGDDEKTNTATQSAESSEAEESSAAEKKKAEEAAKNEEAAGNTAAEAEGDSDTLPRTGDL